MAVFFPLVALLLQADPYAEGMNRFAKGDLPAAIGHFEKAALQSPGNAEYQRVLGIAYAASGDYRKARTPLEFACARSTGDACYNLARALYYGDQYEPALVAIGKVGPSAAALAMRAMILSALGRPEEAARSFEDALRLKPAAATEGRIRLDYGIALYRDGRIEPALEEFDRAAALLPSDARVQKERGRALRQLDRAGDAAKAFQRAIELGDTSRETRLLRDSVSPAQR